MKEPEEYMIRTFEDICKCTNPENLDLFLVDLKAILMHVHLIKAASDGVDCAKEFTWINDGKNNLDFALHSKESKLTFKITDKRKG